MLFRSLTFTGYSYQDLLVSEDAGVQALLEATDLLIDGPFIQEQFDLSRPWVGSRNQGYHFLTKRYQHLQDSLGTIKNKIEVQIRPDGKLLVNGMMDFEVLLEMMNDI